MPAVTRPTLLRTNVEFAKQLFLRRRGDVYVYGGNYSRDIPSIGADCSESAGIYLSAALYGPAAMGWTRFFSTETFPGSLPGFHRVSRQQFLDSDSPLKVVIKHGGGGPNSHMAISIDGWVMESSGTYGTCDAFSGAISQDGYYWNDWLVFDGKITEDTLDRQPAPFPQGVDYAGARISGANLKAAGIKFVCRYLSDGGYSLPGKQLLPDEAKDLIANGIQIVSNWETYANRMREGFSAGVTDGLKADEWHKKCGGPANGVIYFSCDYDAPESDQPAINDYLRGAKQSLGSLDRVGIYAGYWPLKRALDAGVVKWAWQTEAWSGKYRDYRVHIMQRNGLGYRQVAGVECDRNEAYSANFGQWNYSPSLTDQSFIDKTDRNILMALSDAEQRELLDDIRWIKDQLGPNIWGPNSSVGKSQDGQELTLRDGIAALIRDELKKA